MYIAGLNIAASLNQGVESLVVLTTLTPLVKARLSVDSQTKHAEEDSGAVYPSGFTKFITLVPRVALFSTPIIFVLGVGLNRLEQPLWMLRFNFPTSWDNQLGAGGKAAVRTTACLASLACYKLFTTTLSYLGPQLHPIRVRKKARVVSNGPYAYVRHPMYSSALLQEALYAAMFWSYAPLIALGITAAALVIKIPIEESLLESDPSVGPEYVSYKRQVRARLIPYIW